MSGSRRRAPALATRLCPTFVARFWSAHLTPRELGDLGEELVARRLHRGGWGLVARRLATPQGEIDIVARQRGVIVCVEVKSGRGSPRDLRWRPGARLAASTLARQRQAARWLARQLGESTGPARVDLYEVFFQRGRGPRYLSHTDLRQPL